MKFKKSLAVGAQVRSSSSHAHGPIAVPGKMLSKRGGQKTDVKSKVIKERKQKIHEDTSTGFLRRARLRKAVTRKSYHDSWSKFLSFCEASHFLPGAKFRFVSMQNLDEALEAFAESEYLAGESKYTLTCALQNCNIEYPCWPTSS